MTRVRQRGVTLLELMTVVMIIGVLSAIAIPSYRSYLMRSQRSDATAALLRVAQAQEKFYLQNNRYASTAAELAAGPPAGLGISRTEHQFYTIALGAVADNTLSFQATATPVAGGPQAKDIGCATFTIDQQGTRGAKNSSSVDKTESCWR
jgi:type IV pilus assembly protein PilE